MITKIICSPWRLETPVPARNAAWLLVSVSCALALAACGGSSSNSASTTTSASTTNSSAAATSTSTTATSSTSTSSATATTATTNLSALAALGQQLFNDTNLSEPAGTSCASCHTAATGFSNGNGSTLGVAFGSTQTEIGLRNPIAAAYSAATPAFSFAPDPNGVLQPNGGQFWDGRADTLAQQALLPLLNSVEMNNASAAAVVAKVAAASYAPAFIAQFGSGAFSNSATAYTNIGLAIQAYEQSGVFQAFSSKFDAVIGGTATFTASEARGLALFTDPTTANCAGCHTVKPKSTNPADSLFTNNSYHATGIPRNNVIPQNAVATFYDLGLCGPERTTPTVPSGVNANALCGKFKVPSLRNVALRQRYMHNGYFTNLTDVVTFYATRVSNPTNFYGPSGIPNDIPTQYLNNIENNAPPFNGGPGSAPVLTSAQISDLVAFLNTLTDGYTGQ